MSLVIITQRVKFCSDRNERLDMVDQKLTNLVQYCGYLPVPIPNNLFFQIDSQETKSSKLRSWLKAISPSGLILSGGADLGSYPDRDLTENMLLDYAERIELPVLGICRGMQLMARRGQSLLHEVAGHVRVRHLVRGKINRKVNSFHNFSIKSCPKHFEVLARSLDGEIEAIRHENIPMEGWMWHPEREEKFDQQDVKRLKKLFLFGL